MLTKPLQNLWDSAKAILREKSVALKFYITTSQKFKMKRIYRMNVPNFISGSKITSYLLFFLYVFFSIFCILVFSNEHVLFL